MQKFTAELVRFWTAPIRGYQAAVFRVLFSLLSLWTAFGIGLNLERYFAEDGLIPWHVVSGFDWANWSLIALAPGSKLLLYVLFAMLAVASLTLLVGIVPRLSGFVIFVVHLSLHQRNPYIFNSGDRLFLMLAALGMFLPLGRVWSLSAWLRRRWGSADAPLASVWSLRLVQLQICHVYWFSCFAKLKHPRWIQGRAMQDVLGSPLFSEWPVELDSWALGAFLTWSTLLFEFCFPLAVWHKRFRPYVLGAGILFHIGIEITMMIPMFSAIMVVSYALFLSDEEARVLLGRLQRILGKFTMQPSRTPSVLTSPRLRRSRSDHRHYRWVAHRHPSFHG